VNATGIIVMVAFVVGGFGFCFLSLICGYFAVRYNDALENDVEVYEPMNVPMTPSDRGSIAFNGEV
jgi:hypothetical protein